MKFEELIQNLKSLAAGKDVSGRDFLAVQVNITGKNGGVFYVEVKDGKIAVEPYEYYDRNCAITINMDNFMKLMAGDLDPVKAFMTGKLKVEGDVGKALEFSKLLK